MSSWMYGTDLGGGADHTDPPNNESPGDDAGYAESHGGSVSQGTPNEVSKRPHGAAQVRRRNRLITSCLECRRRKLKCDKKMPFCTNCSRFQRDCVYIAGDSQRTLATVKEKMGALEKDLEREVTKSKRTPPIKDFNSLQLGETGRSIPTGYDDTDSSNEDEPDDYLEPTPLAVQDNVYEDDADDDILDLGIQIGKMRLTERLGGWSRPKFVQELDSTLRGGNVTGVPQNQPRISLPPKSYIGPGPEYIAPASSFFFSGTSMSNSLIDYLPSRNAADQLMSHYWYAVHPVCRIVFRPTFEAQYTQFWEHISAGKEPIASLQAIVFAAMFTAAVSLDDAHVLQRFGTSKDALVDSIRAGTEMALAKANFLRTAKVDTIQALVMYILPLVRGEVSRAHSALVGTAIRLAECIGLHRDGSLFNLNPVEVHVRRMIWHQLCFLDLKTCEAAGPRPQIRREDYDTKMPLNVNDIDLLGPDAATEDKTTWTDATILRIRAECVEMRRRGWFEIPLIDKRKRSLTAQLVKIKKFSEALSAKFLPMVDSSVPFHRIGPAVLTMGTQALFVQMLHRYLFYTGTQRMPDRLRQVVIEAGLDVGEAAIAFETDPQLKPWHWYRGAFNHQYHAGMMLLMEAYLFPMRKEAPRMWKCLDYIFEVPPQLVPKRKAELILTELRDRLDVYHRLRKVRGSKQMEENVGAINNPYNVNLTDPNIYPNTDAPPTHHTNAGASSTQPWASLSPPSLPHPESSGSGSQPGGNTAETLASDFSIMSDIDWAEWDKVFHPEINTGDLDIPDFDMADFTGGFNATPFDSAIYDPPASVDTVNGYHMNSVNDDDLADVNFPASVLPHTAYQARYR